MNKRFITLMLSCTIISVFISGCYQESLTTVTVSNLCDMIDARDDSIITEAIHQYTKNIYGKEYEIDKIETENLFTKYIYINGEHYLIHYVDLEQNRDFFRREVLGYSNFDDNVAKEVIKNDMIVRFGPQLVKEFLFQYEKDKVIIKFRDQTVEIERGGKNNE